MSSAEAAARSLCHSGLRYGSTPETTVLPLSVSLISSVLSLKSLTLLSKSLSLSLSATAL